MPSLLLINPRFPESFWSFRWAIDHVLPGKKAVNPPLGLATLAALCPALWRVEIIDENIEPIPPTTDADIVGVCGMGVQFERQRELLAHYRDQGHYVVAGGSFASLCPDEYAAAADTVVAGEAEYVWPEFCRDFEAGTPKPLYHETGTVALADSPVPRYDLLRLGAYSNVTLQFSRGCPFRCEFCDIIVMFGRRPRVKGLDQIEKELDQLRSFGARSVFFVDDNLIGNPKEAKDLLRFLAEYQQRHGYMFSFGTEASLNMAQDDELLELFSAANFGWVFIGIETTDPVGLKETGKTQNLREDTLTAVRRIYSHGIDVLGGFIIGFDHDTLDTFEHQYRFITDAGIQSAMIGLLMALPRTPLHARMEREGRLLPVERHSNNTSLTTNIVPKCMTAEAMAAGYQMLYGRLLTGPEIGRRIRNKAAYLRVPVYGSGYSMGQRVGIVARLLIRGILSGGLSTLVPFLRSFPFLTPSRIPMVISDWIIGLSMKAFAERHLTGTARRREAD
ncbi:B12-binding domain-containing radical SAM protein [Magnetospirillum sp. ME-1]|uniref:B12-binding domain-containing radical SAM protein n=1 Tax=Magnetospirillum sp. ME-1 TaxID=1639348 RepID=UPI000A17E286|nr:radical SAM protein [Magnetospirillum sp. ME-1]ARJ65010.1 B12-binding domain-containing radical SAM protein [Magnetospirillum sp. ME-1]